MNAIQITYVYLKKILVLQRCRHFVAKFNIATAKPPQNHGTDETPESRICFYPHFCSDANACMACHSEPLVGGVEILPPMFSFEMLARKMTKDLQTQAAALRTLRTKGINFRSKA